MKCRYCRETIATVLPHVSMDSGTPVAHRWCDDDALNGRLIECGTCELWFPPEVMCRCQCGTLRCLGCGPCCEEEE